MLSSYPSSKILRRIPNRRDRDYFYSYKNDEFQQITRCQRLFNFISRCFYFITGPKFVVPMLGIAQHIHVPKSQGFIIPDYQRGMD